MPPSLPHNKGLSTLVASILYLFHVPIGLQREAGLCVTSRVMGHRWPQRSSVGCPAAQAAVRQEDAPEGQ